MRLLILTPEFSTSGGGIATFYRALVQAYKALGVDVTVMEGSGVYAPENNQTTVVAGIRVEFLERQRLEAWHSRFGKLSALPILRRHLAAAWAMWEQAGFGERFDVIEACDWGLLFVPAVVTGSRPNVVQCHGSVGQILAYDPVEQDEACSITTRLLERACVQAAQSVQTLSSGNAVFWRDETGREVIAIPPAWSRNTRTQFSSPSRHGLVIGRVQRWKGPQVVCEALRLLGDRAPEIDWIGRDTIWGTVQSSSSAQLFMAYPQVWGHKIHHHPQISPDEVALRQQAARFNLVPSTWDVFNFTCVEAMASGRPTIASTGAGASELIEDGVNGYLFQANDAEALANVLERILTESPERLAEIGWAAQNTISSALDPAKIAARRVAGYQAAIDEFSLGQANPVSEWVSEICQPTKAAASEMAFLERLPLRHLAKHVAQRTVRKVLK